MPAKKAAADTKDTNPVEHGVPTDPAPDALEPTAPSKADVKAAALHDELELLKAQGNKDPDRLAELKKLIAEG